MGFDSEKPFDAGSEVVVAVAAERDYSSQQLDCTDAPYTPRAGEPKKMF